MKRYSILHLPFWSFFSPAFYADVGLRWKGTGFGPLLLLVALCWLAIMIHTQQAFSRFLDREAPKVLKQTPTLHIVKGEVSVDVPQPHAIVFPEAGLRFLVIDTTGGTASLKEADAKMLLTRTQLIYEKSPVETRTFDLSKIEDFTLTPKRIASWTAIIRRYALPLSYPFAVLGSFVFRLLQALLYSLAGLLFALGFGKRLQYAQVLRLTVTAISTVFVLRTVLTVIETPLPSGWIFLLMAMGYLLVGVASASRAAAAAAAPAAPVVMPPPVPPAG